MRNIAVLESSFGGQLRALARTLCLRISLCWLCPPSNPHVHNTEVALGSVGLSFELARDRIPNPAISVGAVRSVLEVRLGRGQKAEAALDGGLRCRVIGGVGGFVGSHSLIRRWGKRRYGPRLWYRDRSHLLSGSMPAWCGNSGIGWPGSLRACTSGMRTSQQRAARLWRRGT